MKGMYGLLETGFWMCIVLECMAREIEISSCHEPGEEAMCDRKKERC